jgi:hypothetical protein
MGPNWLELPKSQEACLTRMESTHSSSMITKSPKETFKASRELGKSTVMKVPFTTNATFLCQLLSNKPSIWYV